MSKNKKKWLDAMPSDRDQVADFLDGLAVEELDALRAELSEKFDELYGEDGLSVSAEDMDKLTDITNNIKAVDEKKATREEEAKTRAEVLKELRSSVHGDTKTEEDSTDEEEATGQASTSEESEEVNQEEKEGELVSASTQDALATTVATAVAEGVGKAFAADYLSDGNNLNRATRHGNFMQYAPDPQVPETHDNPVIVASADIPNFTQGGRIESLEDLGRAMHNRARTLPIGRNGNPSPVPIASMQREFKFNLNSKSTPTQINEVLKAATNVDALIAAGGWCAPSEITYDFFNVVCEDGMIDLPTVGINRGGVQYPTSPSFADIANIEDIVWTWTESDDEDALEPDGPTKPCVRLECPSFVDRRLDCDGFCVTAGNLVDYAYPELVANWLRYVFVIRARATNARLIDLMLNGGGSGDNIGSSLEVDHTGLIGGATTKLLSSVELSAIDYRERYSMCWDAVLEVVMPRWARAVVRADLANHHGVDTKAIPDGMIADWFDMRNVRVQWVSDWQVRSEGLPGYVDPDNGNGVLESFPDELDYMIFAPGTFVRGNGMSLDLGVVRDSVLNETNDHTAAWAEDCYTLLKPGHESRVVTVDLCTAGVIGSRSLNCPES